ncbi:MAG: carboxymuconolactone decarboxylase family protein [Planctomycetaceae bacterium]|nr:carboxymuconolactone decarboxylase family protein [Planctomycetaceae bacterium]
MAHLEVQTKQNASSETAEILAAAEAKYGFIPNLLGVMAQAPIAAKAYTSLMGLMMQSSFTPTERHVVWFTINAEHNCQYCMAAHTAIAKQERISEDIIHSARSGQPYQEERLQELREFTKALVIQRGHVSDEVTQQFLDAGFTRQNILEIVTAIAHKVLSNYTNHLANTPVDEAFSPFAWEKDAV